MNYCKYNIFIALYDTESGGKKKATIDRNVLNGSNQWYVSFADGNWEDICWYIFINNCSYTGLHFKPFWN
jgi:hypothetical protein